MLIILSGCFASGTQPLTVFPHSLITLSSHGPSEDASGRSIKGKAEFIVAKHRSGAVDDVDLRFVAKYARFQNWEDDYGYQQETVESRISMQDSPGAIPAPDPASDPLGSDGTFDLSRLSNDTKAPF